MLPLLLTDISPTSTIISLAGTALLGAGSIITLLLRGIIKYLFDRIATLEGREAGTMQKLISISESQQEAITGTAEFITELVREKEYERRRAQEGGSP
jgi:hypothetical protein